MLKIKITANNRRRYTKKEEIQDLVVDEFQKHKRPLTAKTLVEKGLANHEERARRSFCGILLVLDQSPYYLQFTIKRSKPLWISR